MTKNKASTNELKIKELLTRGVENIYPSRDFLYKLLKSGRRVRVYLGIDPTGPSLHIGHIISLKHLRRFQDLGHEVIMLIGDFTAQIGDPTDKLATRKILTREQVLKNAKLYKKQASKILKFTGNNFAKILFNSKWLDILTLKDLSELGNHITVPRLLERDMFQRRLKSGGTITFTEFMYPLIQGYDSISMAVDGEIGGNDQTFNMLCGRDLAKDYLGKEKFVLVGKLLVDPQGQKMGKTEGNMIALTDTAQDMYGKIMAQPDSLILPYYELVTDLPIEETLKIKKELKAGANPRDIKARLAHEVVKMFYNKKQADKAGKEFDKVFRDKERPTDIPEIQLAIGSLQLAELLVKTGLAKSKSEARRLAWQGGVKIDEKKITDIQKEIKIKDGMVVQKGKRGFVRIRISAPRTG